MVGDLKHGRTVHSLAKLLATYGAREAKVNFVSPQSLTMPTAIVQRLKEANISVTETGSLDEVLGASDVIYWTRVQEERFADQSGYEKVKAGFIMTPGVMDRAPQGHHIDAPSASQA